MSFERNLMSIPFLKVSQLTKYFTTGSLILRAVHHLSFSIKRGETLGLAGESGCGKSTVGKLLMRLIEPTEGSIVFEGQDICHLSSRAMKSLRREMQIIFQNPSSSLNPRMTIEEILSEPLEIHRLAQGLERRKRIEDLLDLVGLQPAYVKRLPHELSGGQKQRISIARALMVQPRFLVWDEPLSALDVSIQAQIVNLLKNLQKKLDLTYLFISHDLSIMPYIADQIAIMYLGQLVELTSSKDLYQNPLHPYTRALLSAIPIPDPSIERNRSRIVLKGDIPSPFHPPSGCPFHPRCPLAQSLCTEIAPQWREIRPGHFTACHYSSSE